MTSRDARRRRPEPARALRRGRGRGAASTCTAYAGARDRAAGPQRRRQVDHDAGAGRGGPAHRGQRARRRATTSAPRRSRSSGPVGYCPDVGGLVPRATPWEHLQLSARLRRLDGWEDRARDLLERFELGDVAHRVTTGFSHGMGRRLSVCLAALHEPEVLLLDEPFDGVDPIGVEATFDVINDARSRGACVLVSTHLRELAVEAC